MIGAYKKRIEGFKEIIEKIEEEEKAERALRMASEEVRRSELKLEGKVEKRTWMKPEKKLQKQEGKKCRILLG